VKEGQTVIETHVLNMICMFSSHCRCECYGTSPRLCKSSAFCWVKGRILSLVFAWNNDILTHSWIYVPLRALASLITDANSSLSTPFCLVQLIVNHTQWNTSYCYLLKITVSKELHVSAH